MSSSEGLNDLAPSEPAWVTAALEADEAQEAREAEQLAECQREDAARMRALEAAYRPAIARAGFCYDRTPPEDWVRAIRVYSPVRDDRSWLELVWEPGDAWGPVQRWELYQMLHPSVVDPGEVDALKGEHPRTNGHMCSEHVPKQFQCFCQPKAECWVGGTGVTITEWKLFRRTGYVGRRYWIIQGKTGGHRYAYTKTESLLLEQEGLDPSAPAPGSLAYAPYDNRVEARIQRFNMLVQFKNNIREWKRAMGAGYGKYTAGQERELRMGLVKLLREQALDVGEDFIAAADAGEMDALPRTEIDYDRLAELAEEHYVETGNVLHHSKI